MKAKSFRELFAQARQDDNYWVHSAVLDFTEELFALMEGHRVNKAELARRLGTSPAYITKILRGDVNFTLRTIAKLGRVFDRRPRLHLAPAETITKWVDVPWQALAARPDTDFTFRYKVKAVTSAPGYRRAAEADTREGTWSRALRSALPSEDPNATTPAAA